LNNEIITIKVSEFLSGELAQKIAAAQWNCPDWSNRVTEFVYFAKTHTDCFNVIAVNECDDVVGRLYCEQNSENSKLWYYGDLCVIPEYRRRHIAERMLALAEQTLIDRWCSRLVCYVEPDNIPSQNLQKKLGFKECPYRQFNYLSNDGEIMFEKELDEFNIIAADKNNAWFVNRIYAKNLEALHGNEITFDEQRSLLSAGDKDERHFLIQKGAVPCAYIKVNGLDRGDVGWISMLAVEPAFQKRRIGEYAVRFAEKFLKEIGKSCVSVHITADNIPAQKLYKKCGYSVAEKCDYITGDGIMRAGYTFTKRI
jgi:ribosomal protein S18 acetylase RimI-like enzyme